MAFFFYIYYLFYVKTFVTFLQKQNRFETITYSQIFTQLSYANIHSLETVLFPSQNQSFVIHTSHSFDRLFTNLHWKLKLCSYTTKKYFQSFTGRHLLSISLGLHDIAARLTLILYCLASIFKTKLDTILIYTIFNTISRLWCQECK